MSRRGSAERIGSHAVNDALGAMSFAVMLSIAAALTEAVDAEFVSPAKSLNDVTRNDLTATEHESRPT